MLTPEQRAFAGFAYDTQRYEDAKAAAVARYGAAMRATPQDPTGEIAAIQECHFELRSCPYLQELLHCATYKNRRIERAHPRAY